MNYCATLKWDMWVTPANSLVATQNPAATGIWFLTTKFDVDNPQESYGKGKKEMLRYGVLIENINVIGKI